MNQRTRRNFLSTVAGATSAGLAPNLLGQTAAEQGFDFLDYQPTLEPIVERGLLFLARQQRANGTYAGKYGEETGMVGLSGMAFLAKGYLPDSGPYRFVLHRCIDYILGSAREDGILAYGGRHMFYNHALSTLFLSEVSGMVDAPRQAKISRVLPHAIRALLDAQAAPKAIGHKGGWRYTPNSSVGDLSVTGWCLMALRSARQGGAPVPDESIANAVEFIRKSADSSTGGFSYLPTSTNSTPSMTAVGLLCLELTGSHGDELLQRSADHILLKIREPRYAVDPYLNYYAAQGMFQLGGRYWKEYANFLYANYPRSQRPDGSWRFKDKLTNDPIYSTSLVLLALTVPYRQLPIYQRDEQV